MKRCWRLSKPGVRLSPPNHRCQQSKAARKQPSKSQLDFDISHTWQLGQTFSRRCNWHHRRLVFRVKFATWSQRRRCRAFLGLGLLGIFDRCLRLSRNLLFEHSSIRQWWQIGYLDWRFQKSHSQELKLSCSVHSNNDFLK